MKIEQLLIDHSIPYVTEHKNVRYGWIGVHCPFCPGEQNYHLGYSADENYFSCWRCGGHSATNTISKLLSISYTRAEEVIKEYGGNVKTKKVPRVRVGTNKFKLPSGDLSLQPYHKHYLAKRKFDWEYLQEVWGIMGTGPVSKLDELSYARRILAPIHWNEEMVSFQARDITGRHKAKYMACPPEREKISHKHILYGIQEKWGKRGLCVEGITDAWRLGTDAVATFGVKFTRHQIRNLAKHFEELVLLYDPEEAAQDQAKQLIDELNFKGVKAWTVDLPSDPGEMDQSEADYLVKDLMK